MINMRNFISELRVGTIYRDFDGDICLMLKNKNNNFLIYIVHSIFSYRNGTFFSTSFSNEVEVLTK